MINSRDIKDLNAVVAEKCKAHIAACKTRGVDIIVTSTLRDDEYQATLYAKGRTDKSSGIVTNLKVTGAHGFGLAYDVVPVVKGVAVWNDPKLWAIVGEEGKKLGLVWGGAWKTFVDKPHFELTEGLTATQLRAGKRPSWYNKKPAAKPVEVKQETKPATVGVKVGDMARINANATVYATGQKIPPNVKIKPYTVIQVKPDRVLLKELMSWLKIADVTKV